MTGSLEQLNVAEIVEQIRIELAAVQNDLNTIAVSPSSALARRQNMMNDPCACCILAHGQ